jgi:hypothetical protein
MPKEAVEHACLRTSGEVMRQGDKSKQACEHICPEALEFSE